MKTLPGVISNDSSDFRLAFNNTNAFHVNGLRGSDNNFFLDGAVNTDVGANDGQYTQLSMDAVGELKIQSNNFAAEYGRNPGILMAVNTKSGGKRFHGENVQIQPRRRIRCHNIWPERKNYVRFNQFGGNLGGPIPLPGQKDKLFFFFNYERTRGITPGNTQFNSQTIAGVGKGYTLPNPAILTRSPTAVWISLLSTPECVILLQVSNCAGSSGYNQGQVFVPGSVT